MAEELKYKITGTVFDRENNLDPLSEAKIFHPNGTELTNNKGKFTIEGNYISGSIFEVTVLKEGYAPQTITPFSQNKTLKTNIGPIVLNTIKESLKEATQEELKLPQAQVNLLIASKSNFETAQQKALNNIVTQIKTILMPLILTQIAKFGITNLAGKSLDKLKELPNTCPTPEELKIIIDKKNRLVKQLNNIYEFLKSIKIGVEILDGTITAAQIVITTLKNIPAPAPSNTSSILIDIENKLKKYKIIASSTLIILTILIEILQRILGYLSLLDNLVEKCNPPLITQEQLSIGLIQLTQEVSQESPVVTNVNGFEMGVESETNTPNELKRRRAIAKNKQGIIMLRGEWSFSSNDQILIDELVFYIEQNDLKAE